jgi:hypothetical protein
MTEPLIDALRDLVQSADALTRFLDYPKPPYTPDEAYLIDLQHELCTCQSQP